MNWRGGNSPFGSVLMTRVVNSNLSPAKAKNGSEEQIETPRRSGVESGLFLAAVGHEKLNRV